MEFGLGRKRILQGAIPLLVIGGLAAAAAAVAMALGRLPMKDPSAARRAEILLFLLLFPSAFWLVFAAALGSVTLRLTDRAVEQVLWRRFVLRRLPIDALTRVTGGGFSAMVLHFRGRRRMALPGIYVGDRQAFLAALDERRPELRLLERD